MSLQAGIFPRIQTVLYGSRWLLVFLCNYVALFAEAKLLLIVIILVRQGEQQDGYVVGCSESRRDQIPPDNMANMSAEWSF